MEVYLFERSKNPVGILGKKLVIQKHTKWVHIYKLPLTLDLHIHISSYNVIYILSIHPKKFTRLDSR